jgi:hypothetical protein
MRLIVRKKDVPKEQAFVESLVLAKPEPKKDSEDSKSNKPKAIENSARNESTNSQHSTTLSVKDNNFKLKSEDSKTEIPVIKSQSIAASQTSHIEEQNNETQEMEMEVEDNESSHDFNDVVNYVRKKVND